MNKEERYKIEEEINRLKSKLLDIQLKEKQEIINSHSPYIGKYYKMEDGDNIRYLQPICEYSTNEFHMECLVFDITPKLSKEFHLKQIMSASDKLRLSLSCTPFWIEEIGLFCYSFKHTGTILDGYKEITKEEFNNAMKICFEQFNSIIHKIVEDKNIYQNG